MTNKPIYMVTINGKIADKGQIYNEHHFRCDSKYKNSSLLAAYSKSELIYHYNILIAQFHMLYYSEESWKRRPKTIKMIKLSNYGE